MNILITGASGFIGQRLLSSLKNKNLILVSSKNRKGYIKINPCLWGYDEGLIEPPYLSWNTTLMSIKRNNNTWGHYGEMASWQMRGILV